MAPKAQTVNLSGGIIAHLKKFKQQNKLKKAALHVRVVIFLKKDKQQNKLKKAALHVRVVIFFLKK
jgi:hypothetical protein